MAPLPPPARRRRRIGLGVALVAVLFTLGAPAAPKNPKSKSTAVPKRSAPEKRAPRPSEPGLPRVPPVDFTRVRLSDFTDGELDLPFYLVHFHEVANGMDERGPTKGYLRFGGWRATQAPYNARVMENILALAWFYAQKRPWNQYYDHPAVRARLEAALDFWCRSQGPDGKFTEHGPKSPALAPTAFATKFIGEAMALLRDAPLDEKLRARVLGALRSAVVVTLTDIAFYDHGRQVSNQFGNVWGGGLTLLALAPDPSLRAFLESRFRGSREDFQSPAGFFYEKSGPDWGYTLGTHSSNVAQAYKFMRGTRLEPLLIDAERRWMEWLAWNAVPEPDGGFILNRAIETRQQHSSFRSYESPFTDRIPFARALSESSEERSVRLAHLRGKLTATFPRVPELDGSDSSSYSPYTFLNRDVPDLLPPARERDAARALLPSVLPGSAVGQRHDPRMPATFTFVRRPSYYAAFTAGKKAAGQQRLGLGLFFNPGYGAVLQTQSAGKGSEQSFGTRNPQGPHTFESDDLDVKYTLNEKPLPGAEDGARELPKGTLGIEYELGTSGRKALTFAERALEVSVTLPGELVETLPLLVVPGGAVVLSKGKARVESKTGSCEVRFAPGVEASVEASDERILTKQLVMLTLRARDQLAYSLACTGKRPPTR